MELNILTYPYLIIPIRSHLTGENISKYIILNNMHWNLGYYGTLDKL